VRSLSITNQEGGNVYHISPSKNNNSKATVYAADQTTHNEVTKTANKKSFTCCIPCLNTPLKLAIFILILVIIVAILIVGIVLIIIFAIGYFLKFLFTFGMLNEVTFF
jgi:ABC-type nickel/cobalt efflux system permease component RcnA